MKASISLDAPKSAASTVSRTRPRTRLVRVAMPASAAERAIGSRIAAGDGLTASGGLECVDDSETDMRLGAAERLSYELVDGLAVHSLAGEAGHHRLHDPAHVLRRRRTGLRDRVGDRALDRSGVDGGWKVRFEHGDFGGFLVCEILPSAFQKLFNRITALLDEGADDLP